MIVGIIYVCYQSADLLPMSLTPWIEARAARVGGYQFKICAVSVPFEGFDHAGDPPDDTRSRLGYHLHIGDIDHAIVRDKPMKETDARGAALNWLVKEGADLIVQADSDEEFRLADIERILAFVHARPHVGWFRISYKNLVFTPYQYLVEPFTPPRIHRVRVGDLTANHFWDDNNIGYSTSDPGRLRRDIELPSITIPRSVAWVKHWTWLNNERSLRKCEYQVARWGDCSFRWDDDLGLQFNEAYFARRGLPLPEVARES